MKFLSYVLPIIVVFTVHSDPNIYSEDFSNDWKKGAITYGGITPAQPTDGGWSWTNVGSPDNDGGSASSWNDMAFIDGAAVMSSTGSNSSTLAFRWNDVNNGSTSNRVDWYSKLINGQYNSISISIDYEIGNGSTANSIYVYYIIDGGTAVEFGSSVNKSSASGTFTVSSLSCNTSIKLYAKAITRDFNSSYVLIDNVSITGTSVALPIELIHFKPFYEDGKVKCDWSTASERNNDYFTIEKSIDGLNYQVVGVIDGAGNSTNKLDYYFEDINPSYGLIYYRLKQTDFDGMYSRTEWCSVKIYDIYKNIKIYPNPANSEINIIINSELNVKENLHITDLFGNIVYESILELEFGDNNINIKIPNLPIGVYFISLNGFVSKLEHY